jgi:hypothetical protein
MCSIRSASLPLPEPTSRTERFSGSVSCQARLRFHSSHLLHPGTTLLGVDSAYSFPFASYAWRVTSFSLLIVVILAPPSIPVNMGMTRSHSSTPCHPPPSCPSCQREHPGERIVVGWHSGASFHTTSVRQMVNDHPKAGASRSSEFRLQHSQIRLQHSSYHMPPNLEYVQNRT